MLPADIAKHLIHIVDSATSNVLDVSRLLATGETSIVAACQHAILDILDKCTQSMQRANGEMTFKDYESIYGEEKGLIAKLNSLHKRAKREVNEWVLTSIAEDTCGLTYADPSACKASSTGAKSTNHVPIHPYSSLGGKRDTDEIVSRFRTAILIAIAKVEEFVLPFAALHTLRQLVSPGESAQLFLQDLLKHNSESSSPLNGKELDMEVEKDPDDKLLDAACSLFGKMLTQANLQAKFGDDIRHVHAGFGYWASRKHHLLAEATDSNGEQQEQC